ncbi:Ni,Fe-hydrogenase I large subunit [Anoxybacter fermentans]|uniref:Ni,Fe-hydrogenase I large subunit n=1 Tax=Anoxybacter fermentans TaxID=1323375 RepID=A0A3Q9HPT3_9FIRM|nr:nickel-dependent hydrogenase large subunit [Anoxybacter fermentans]AZR72946.1 Ni,Fe-hydrogenase I large subunit [Anoxybacter fermentans]
MAKIKIDPVTRIEGHLAIEVDIDSNNNVIYAHSTGNLFRGFEKILIGRDPRDAVHLTQRICGVCPVSHCMASVNALENAFGYTPSDQARIIRNLILGSNFIASHILHFYHLAALDYIQGPEMEPWTPHYNTDCRLTSSQNQAIIDNYVAALEARRKAHEMAAIFAGKMPHVTTVLPGGVSVTPTSESISKFNMYLDWIIDFINNKYIPDVNTIADAYSDYFSIGVGNGNLLAYGVFDLDNTGNYKLFRRGVYTNGTISELDESLIKEYVMYSWYDNSDTNKHPSNGSTTPTPDKSGAYSWLKAPRYNGEPFELGPLARMTINGDYTNGISVMDRHLARAQEARKIAYAMKDWLLQLEPEVTSYDELTVPNSRVGVGLTEAPRGAVGHWIAISDSKISHYQVITPTCWNASPRDDNGNPGPIEGALVGTNVANVEKPIEILRIVHSYDPCTGCSVHVSRADREVISEFIVNPVR